MTFRLVLFLFVGIVTPSGAFATPFHLDDIQYWVGSGAKRAGFAIDWDGDDMGLANTPSLAWGYYWNGTATADDALRAILAEDERLFAKLSAGGGLGAAVYGIGYDLNDDGAFATTFGASYGPDGIAITGPSDFSTSVDPADAYREGWSFSFWHFATTTGPGASGWSSSNVGISQSTLVDETWVGLAHTPTFSLTAFANSLDAATPPASLAGDFNNDGVVNSADYVKWRATLGDEPSYNVWRNNFGAVAPSSAVAGAISGAFSLNVPEPCALGILLTCLAAIGIWPIRGSGQIWLSA